MSDDTPSHKLGDLRRVYSPFRDFTRPDCTATAACALTIAVAVITNAMMIWLLGMPFGLIQQGRFDDVAMLLAGFAAVVVINQLAQFSGGWLMQWLGLNFNARVRNAMLARVVHVSFSGAAKWAKGDLLTRLSSDVDRVRYCLVDTPLFLFSHVLTATIYVAMLFWIDVWLALVALAITPAFVLHQRVLGRRKRFAADRVATQYSSLLALEEEVLSNLRGIATARAEDYVAHVHRDAVEHARAATMRERVIDVVFTVSFSFLIFVIGMAIVYFGIDGVRAERFNAGHLVSFLLYLGYLAMPARGAADIFLHAFGNAPCAARIQEVLTAADSVTEHPDALDMPVKSGEIELRNVSFGYSNSAKILDRVSLKVRAGESIALVGPSGSGKTTLALLLMRFIDVTDGEIIVDGLDVRRRKLAALRRGISMVWQEPYLMSGTLRDNFKMFVPDTTDDAIRYACVASHAAEFIDALPGELDTRIGSGGITLSVGQKQRIALAQTFLQNPPILVLDEATSALDSQSEQAVVDGLAALRVGRTTLLIAHRYSSLKAADRVVYFNGNGTISVGTHDELLARHPAYKNALEWQTRIAD